MSLSDTVMLKISSGRIQPLYEGGRFQFLSLHFAARIPKRLKITEGKGDGRDSRDGKSKGKGKGHKGHKGGMEKGNVKLPSLPSHSFPNI